MDFSFGSSWESSSRFFSELAAVTRGTVPQYLQLSQYHLLLVRSLHPDQYHDSPYPKKVKQYLWNITGSTAGVTTRAATSSTIKTSRLQRNMRDMRINN
ncbi:hypothetical protein FNV43_RR08788 [Rhamnella rubrinervis]|uniref:Uncharacterized protein n=1 Tax=Rhamnella rubrinervis TaxID=2594499 RepID=A0A8K0H9X9_9ROSA|nr:hypothetical protein FNV43_RR08788 [Rhamnella rubrinervis]